MIIETYIAAVATATLGVALYQILKNRTRVRVVFAEFNQQPETNLDVAIITNVAMIADIYVLVAKKEIVLLSPIDNYNNLVSGESTIIVIDVNTAIRLLNDHSPTTYLCIRNVATDKVYKLKVRPRNLIASYGVERR